MSAADDVDDLVVQFQKSGLRELHLRCDDLEIHLSTDSAQPGISRSRGSVPAPVPRTAAAPVAPAQPGTPPRSRATPVLPDGATVVRAPYLGTFYRAPKPGAPPYVEVGTRVSPATELCMVEVMKLFTSIRAGIVAEVHAVLAEDGQMVQADQPLFVLVPA